MLIDTNIIIEIAREQEFYLDCLYLVKAIKNDQFKEEVYLTRFALHAIEALIAKKNKDFLREILLMIHQDKIKIFDSNIADDIMTLSVMQDLEFDFDDATQYFAANRLRTYLVTFDKGFTGKGVQVKTPAEVLKEILA